MSPVQPPTRGPVLTSLPMATPLRVFLLLAVPFLGACRGDRILRIESVPPGATVRLDDNVIGRTPLEIDFENYGQRRLSLYKATYRTYSEPLVIRAPWWARFPIDLVTEVLLPLGLDDVREKRIVLVADAGDEEATEATQEFIGHALRARDGDKLIDVPLAGESPSSIEEADHDVDVKGGDVKGGGDGGR